MLDISAYWLGVSLLSSFDISLGMLLGLTNLFESSGDIMLYISALLVELE